MDYQIECRIYVKKLGEKQKAIKSSHAENLVMKIVNSFFDKKHQILMEGQMGLSVPSQTGRSWK